MYFLGLSPSYYYSLSIAKDKASSNFYFSITLFYNISRNRLVKTCCLQWAEMNAGSCSWKRTVKLRGNY